jgi:TolA-binding protein
MRRAVCLILVTLALSACDQRGGSDVRLANAEAQERARQEKVAKEMVAQTEDQVRVKMLEQRLAALEAQVALMQGDRKLLDAQLVEQRLNQIEAGRIAGDAAPVGTPTPAASPTAAGRNSAPPSPARAPKAAATPSARKPLVLDLR